MEVLMNVKLLSEENRKIYETQLLNKTGFFEESPGVKSGTRLVYITGAYWIMAMATYMCYTKAGSPVEIGAFLTTGLAALGGVKYFGTKNESKLIENNKE
jgi:hypothetical protein